MICKYRPTTPVLAFTPDFTLSRQLSLLRGCIGVYAANILNPETMLDIVVDEGRRRGYIASGDTIIGVFGRQGEDRLKAEVMQIYNVNE
jgi:pyruvate kinase